MLKDERRTCFLVVCIAEYLSIQETHRLLQDLNRQKVTATHVLVNQLVNPNSAIDMDIEQLKDRLQVIQDEKLRQSLLDSAQLTSARHNIQQKYLKMLRATPEAQKLRIVPLPLLAKEVTGPENLLSFSQKMVPENYRKTAPGQLNDDNIKAAGRMYGEEQEDILMIGSKASVQGLVKQPKYNNVIGVIKDHCADGRYALHIMEGRKKKTLLLKAGNLRKEADDAEPTVMGGDVGVQIAQQN